MKSYWVLLLVLVCALGLAAQPSGDATGSAQQAAPDELMIEGRAVGKRVPFRPGDTCVLCYRTIEEEGAVYLVHGQRVPLHVGEMHDAPPQRLRALLAQLQPRGAFLGAGPGKPVLATGWFVFGLYMLVGLVFAAFCAHRALHAGYSPVRWLIAGLVFNIFAYGFLLTRPKREVLAPAGIPAGLRKISTTHAPVHCPKCGGENHPSAPVCGGCGATLVPKATSEVARAELRAC